MMHEYQPVNLVILKSEVTAVVSDDDFSLSIFPELRVIELLIEPAVKSECVLSDFSIKLEILETLLESWE
jgi:hypothetical protein